MDTVQLGSFYNPTYSCAMGTEATDDLRGLMIYVGPSFQRCIFVEYNLMFASCLRCVTPKELPCDSPYAGNDPNQTNDFYYLAPPRLVYLRNNHSSIFLSKTCNFYIQSGEWLEVQVDPGRETLLNLTVDNAKLALSFLEAHARAEN